MSSTDEGVTTYPGRADVVAQIRQGATRFVTPLMLGQVAWVGPVQLHVLEIGAVVLQFTDHAGQVLGLRYGVAVSEIDGQQVSFGTHRARSASFDALKRCKDLAFSDCVRPEQHIQHMKWAFEAALSAIPCGASCTKCCASECPAQEHFGLLEISWASGQAELLYVHPILRQNLKLLAGSFLSSELQSNRCRGEILELLKANPASIASVEAVDVKTKQGQHNAQLKMEKEFKANVRSALGSMQLGEIENFGSVIVLWAQPPVVVSIDRLFAKRCFQKGTLARQIGCGEGRQIAPGDVLILEQPPPWSRIEFLETWSKSGICYTPGSDETKTVARGRADRIGDLQSITGYSWSTPSYSSVSGCTGSSGRTTPSSGTASTSSSGSVVPLATET
mmetsp:Transcript_25502/g.57918  ORF Transcript_25502/g.57918 Transcript_25502/m.57918 type:complete len:391 (+) Transcript_25502:54-1226(+)